MKNEKISSAMSMLDEDIIQAAEDIRIERKKIKLNGIKIGMAACFCLLTAAAVAIPLLLNKNSGELTASDNRWPEKIIHGSSVTEDEIAIIHKWNELSISQQFPEAIYSGITYSMRNAEVSADKITNTLGSAAMSGYDIYEDKTYNIVAEIYGISGIKKECAVALRFEGQEKYYVYVNSFYKPKTLGEFIDALDLHNNLTVGSVWYNEFDSSQKYRSFEFMGLNSSTVWKMLLSDTSAEATSGEEFDARQFDTALDISVDVPMLGYENISIAVTKDGYLTTNILDTGKAFYIGADKTEAFIKYVFDNCEGYELVYSEDETGIPE